MLELHRLLLGDRARNDAFVAALKKVIVPGKTTVADIGSGTGFLSFVAEKLGAKECRLYETSADMVALSRKLARENGITRCTFCHGHSTAIKNPPKADVVISETLGNWAYEENIIETMNDAHRFLKPGGILIPQKLRCFIAPVTTPRLYQELNVWDRVGQGLTFDAAKALCMNNMYVKEVRAEDLLPESIQEWDAVEFSKNENDSICENTIHWDLKKDTVHYGYACFWECMVIDDITISTSPAEPPTHWKKIYLPLLDPLPVKAGETVRLRLTSDSRYAVKINVAWETRIIGRNGEELVTVKQDMKKGTME